MHLKNRSNDYANALVSPAFIGLVFGLLLFPFTIGSVALIDGVLCLFGL